MSRTYSVTYRVEYTVETEIEAEDYDDLNEKIDERKGGYDIDAWDLDCPDYVDVYNIRYDGQKYRHNDEEGNVEEDREEEVDEDEEDEAEEAKSE